MIKRRRMIVDYSLQTHFPLAVINYHKRGQKGKTIIHYHEDFERVQSE